MVLITDGIGEHIVLGNPATIAGPRAANAHGFHNAMNGKVDEVGIFGRELCSHEVNAVFDAGAGLHR